MSLFPSWRSLLSTAAKQLETENKLAEAAAVRQCLDGNAVDYLEAARRARAAMGSAWFTLLKDLLDPRREEAATESLALAESIWTLGSKLIITTNYDRVLHWTCPDRDNLRVWNIEATAELAELMRIGLSRPTVWHLHGCIDDVQRIILTPDGYDCLYMADTGIQESYHAALQTLRSLLMSRTFLFVGFSLDDTYFGDQLKWVQSTFRGCAGSHYVLVREVDLAQARVRLEGLPVAPVPFPDFGDPLVAVLRGLGRDLPSPEVRAAEYRQLTLMSCGLAPDGDPAALASSANPENVAAMLRDFHRLCEDITDRFHGRVTTMAGAELLIYFGYPEGYEYNAYNATKAALEIIEAIKAHSASDLTHPVPLVARIGIHTDRMLVDPEGIEGLPWAVAQQLRMTADPNTVTVSDATCRLIDDQFECWLQGGPDRPGGSAAYRVLRARGERRFRPTLVGRQQELEQLLDCWRRVEAGDGQVVLVSGEPGIGKSRLMHEFRTHVGSRARWIHLFCQELYRNSTFYPVIETIQREIGIVPEHLPEVKLSRLEQALGRYNITLAPHVPLLADLLLIPLAGRYPPLDISPALRREKTLQLLASLPLALVANGPIAILVEDVHWADPSTLALLDYLVVRSELPTAPILIVVTKRLRPPMKLQWRDRSYVTPIKLTPLTQDQTTSMIRNLPGGADLSPEDVHKIVTSCGGSPFHTIEETNRKVRGHAPSRGQMQAVARVDRLQNEAARRVAQLGCVLGSTFLLSVLRAFAEEEQIVDTAFQLGLDELLEEELLEPVYERGHAVQRMRFHHVILQKELYDCLPPSRREQYHKQVAGLFVRSFPQVLESQPEMVAHHFTRAGLPERAIPLWHQAGQKAVQQSAHEEAIRHLQRAMELLPQVGDTRKRIGHELKLRVTVGEPLLMTRGYAAAEVQDNYMRARELCQDAGDTMEVFHVLWWLWTFDLVQARFPAALADSEEFMRRATRVNDQALQANGMRMLGVVHFYLGALEQSKKQLTAAADVFRLLGPRPHDIPYAEDPYMVCLAYSGLVSWLIGEVGHDVENCDDAVGRAVGLRHPYSFAFAINWRARLSQFRREPAQASNKAHEGRSVAREKGFVLWDAMATMLEGWSQVEQTAWRNGMRARLRSS